MEIAFEQFQETRIDIIMAAIVVGEVVGQRREGSNNMGNERNTMFLDGMMIRNVALHL